MRFFLLKINKSVQKYNVYLETKTHSKLKRLTFFSRVSESLSVATYIGKASMIGNDIVFEKKVLEEI